MRSKKPSRKRRPKPKPLADRVDWQRVFDFGPEEAKAILAKPSAQRVFVQVFEETYPWAFSQATTLEDAFGLAYTEAIKETCGWLYLR